MKNDPRSMLLSSEFRSCVKVKVAILGSLFLLRLAVSVDVKHHERKRFVYQSSEAM